MSINPYQPSTDAAVNTKEDRFGRLVRRLETHRQRLVVRGMRTMRIGYSIFLLSLTAIGTVGLYQSAWLRPQSTASMIACSFAGIGLVIAIFGLSNWTALNGVSQKLSLLALTVQMIAIIAMIAYISAMLSGRPVSGLMQLFGASAFATLLTSQAIIALVVRSWAVLAQCRFAAHACEVAIIGCAVCAATCSSVALRAIPTGNSGTNLLIIGAGLVGIGSLTLSLTPMIRRWELAAEATAETNTAI